MRIKAVIVKELKSFFRDRGFVLAMFVAPFALMAVFGYTFQADLRELATVVVDGDHSKYSQTLRETIDASPYFAEVDFTGDAAAARALLRQSRVRAVFYIPADFEKKLAASEKPNVDLYLDSSDYTVYNILRGAAADVVRASLPLAGKVLSEGVAAQSAAAEQAVRELRQLAREANAEFNVIKNEINTATRERQALLVKLNTINAKLQNLHVDLDEWRAEPFAYELLENFEFGRISYFAYLTPAIMTLILFFIGLVITTINLVDEKNNRTLIRLAATPLRKSELFFGKFIVFLLIGVIEVLYVLVLAIFVYDVSIVGSVWLVILLLILLMAASTGLGLLFSSFVRTMRQAVILLPLVVIPSVLLSQTFSPIDVMPRAMRLIAYLSPMYYSNCALREVMIKGADISEIWPQAAVLVVYAAITLTAGMLLHKKRFD